MPFLVEEEFFGLYASLMTKKVERIRRFTITNENKMSVSILNYGATVAAIRVPDAYNTFADVVQGFDDVAGYTNAKDYYIGATVGRVVDQITGARMHLNEIEINLSKNLNETDHFNGGFMGFNTVVWDLADILPNGIILQHTSADGHEGYPGNLSIRITFQLTNFNGLRILIEAETDQPTVVNIGNNILFNLVGHAAGKMALGEHSIIINSNYIIDIDKNLRPTGEFRCVADTVFDMHVPTNIGERLKQFRNMPIKGYDTCFCVNEANGTDVIQVAYIKHATSGRVLEVFTNQPGIRFYTGNNLPEERIGEFPLVGKSCKQYLKNGSFSLMPMKYPDALHHPNFPTVQLDPGQKYISDSIYKFSVEESWKCCRDI